MGNQYSPKSKITVKDNFAEIELSNSDKIAIIDIDDIYKVKNNRWLLNKRGARSGYGTYLTTTIMGRKDGFNLKRLNSNPLDCRKSNYIWESIYSEITIKDGYAEVTLSNSDRKAKIDIDCIDLIKGYKWMLHIDHNSDGDGYAAKTTGEFDRMHHIILPKKNGFQVDHLNRDRCDNRKCNLRYAKCAQNMQNRGLLKSNSSGYIGVSLKYNWYISRIQSFGEKINLGKFKNPIEAAIARDKKAIEIHGEFAVLNFPNRLREDGSYDES